MPFTLYRTLTTPYLLTQYYSLPTHLVSETSTTPCPSGPTNPNQRLVFISWTSRTNNRHSNASGYRSLSVLHSLWSSSSASLSLSLAIPDRQYIMHLFIVFRPVPRPFILTLPLPFPTLIITTNGILFMRASYKFILPAHLYRPLFFASSSS